MNNKIFSFLTLLTICAVMSSCKENNDRVVNEWKKQNTKVFEQIASDPSYKEIKSTGNEGSIYYKELKKGKGTSPIYYTSIVQLYYKGWFVVTNKEMNIGDKTIITQRTKEQDHYPAEFQVRNGGKRITEGMLLRGIQVALQQMVVGDKWEVWIPYQLGYGVSNATYSAIPSYSTVVFEIEVVNVRN